MCSVPSQAQPGLQVPGGRGICIGGLSHTHGRSLALGGLFPAFFVLTHLDPSIHSGEGWVRSGTFYVKLCPARDLYLGGAR